jgi:glycerate 2-kinase
LDLRTAEGTYPRRSSALDTNIAHLICLVQCDLGTNFSNTPGAGGAGGFGYEVLTFLNEQIMPGFNVVAEKVGLRERITSTYIVTTGEERLDFQTLQGKTPYGVALLAKQLDKPVWAIWGRH